MRIEIDLESLTDAPIQERWKNSYIIQLKTFEEQEVSILMTREGIEMLFESLDNVLWDESDRSKNLMKERDELRWKVNQLQENLIWKDGY
jgi:hypothetical protein